MLAATLFLRFGLPFRWHPRWRLAARALPLCGAAPTFFAAAAAAKKVGKESGLTPLILVFCPRARNVPVIHTTMCSFGPVANVLAKRLTGFKRPYEG
jgi:hypothetical protein